MFGQIISFHHSNEGDVIATTKLHLYLIFVTYIAYISLGGKVLVMWRNFRFKYMTDVEKFQILHMQRNFSFFHTIDAEKCEFLPNLEEFHISPHDRCEEIKNLPCFVVVKSVF